MKERYYLCCQLHNSFKLGIQSKLKCIYGISRPEVFLGKGVLKICSKFTGEHPSRSVISIKWQTTLRHGCSPANLLHILRKRFSKNTSGWLLLYLRILIIIQSWKFISRVYWEVHFKYVIRLYKGWLNPGLKSKFTEQRSSFENASLISYNVALV